ELGDGVLGDDIGLIAALGDHAVQARLRSQLLAHLIERHEELDHRVERVDAAPRPRRRMRRLAEELALDLDDPEARPPHERAAAAVDHHRRIHVAEDAGLHQPDLPGAALLGRRADHDDPAVERQRAERRGDRGARAAAGRGDDVVPAGVPDVRKGIVLGHDRDRRTGTLTRDRGPKRRRQSADAALDARAMRAEELGEPGRGLLLLERELGIVVDPMAQSLQLVRELLDRLCHSCLGVFEHAVVRHARALRNSCWACSTRAGSDRRSSVVIAMVFAAATSPWRASGLTAASANSRLWIGVPSGAMPIIGWIAGMTWLTLPMSEDPRRSGIGSPSTSPTDAMLAANRSSRT